VTLDPTSRPRITGRRPSIRRGSRRLECGHNTCVTPGEIFKLKHDPDYRIRCDVCQERGKVMDDG
jgi:hypothetical protein